MSKGDNRRPANVPKEEFESNWEKTFGKKKTLTDKELLARVTELAAKSNIILFTDSSPMTIKHNFLEDVESIFMDGASNGRDTDPV
jgi:hypothetical protein